ncbi:A disintegrin and metalloproteinase with thrombospondin motifs 2-like isoform X2 [Gouania willdenowi]|nr:A disintegrin and metalloproteinase with thrombospondin motifs 2-like isoform X2 [Gouania willdenowi]XP_028322106.1 A disintegrin and metalloproteinase with thrombospondin motifs 2-like isoform X2 [Gouania willdenowi]XP_028322107.1 A disintegrin and metalloproteinase with thrombospondin motifs 2-like isoform X2 [Gouania willdenowi]
MIRTSQDEFFIEPLDQRRPGGEEGEKGEEEDEEERQRHIIYRSSAIIMKKSASTNRTSDDLIRDHPLGSVVLDQKLEQLDFRLSRRRRYIEEAELFNIEVLLAVDYSILLFHGRDQIQNYLLTLMNIVNEIYQDYSLGVNMNVVLVRIIMLSASKSQELVVVGNPQKSLENVCGWSYLQQRDESHAQQYDHTIYLTRQEFGPSGMQGYAPVTGMCQLHRSCALVFEDGFMSAFVAAHETGHVLGMEHDGEANDCGDDVSFGSIMSPNVQASFWRYHWSRCSWRELQQNLHSYDCLRDDPFNHNWPVPPPLPGFQHSMEEQCRLNFGPGFSVCTAYPTPEPCKQLWCSDNNNPFYCRTKKGSPLDGTRCGPGQHCLRGLCLRLTSDLLRQSGGWGEWGPYGSCSRSCGGGVRFRARRCDNPPPTNGGRRCVGNTFEFQLCSREDCPPMTDFREDQCKVWNPFIEHEGKKHHWLPYEHPDPDQRCRLHCRSKQTADVVFMNRTVYDGTLCSYGDAYSVCVRGDCEHVGCDGQIASDQQEDRCGVCGGDNSSCKIIRGNFTRSTKKAGFLKILELPKGVRHLLVQEFKGTPHALAVKNQVTGEIFLNHEGELPETRVVIEGGTAWQYSNTEHRESLQTTGPLQYDALLMVRSDGESKVSVSYKYIIQERAIIQSNLLHEDAVFYEWALKKWSSCSKTCGGGKQYTRFGCRRKADGKMVERMFCSNVNKPRAISRSCNSDACETSRWLTGPWAACSASCGQSGWQRRWVSCQQRTRSVHSKLCSDPRPISKRTCNRNSCPPTWRAGPWTLCSAPCGNGTQERQVACSRHEGSMGNCSEPRPSTKRVCQSSPCNGDQKNTIVQWLSKSSPNFTVPHTYSHRCRGDRSVFCQMEALSRYCTIPGYRKMCCKSCSEANLNNSSNSSSPSHLSNPRNSTDPSTFSSTNSPTEMSSLWTTQVMTSSFTPSERDYDVITDVIKPRHPTSLVTPAPDGSHFVYVDYDEYYEDPNTVGSSSSAPTVAPPLTFEEPPIKHTTTHLPDFFSLSAATDDITTTSSSSSLSPLPEKRNSQSEEVLYRIVGLDSVQTQQSYFVPRIRERTQNQRIQQLLNEKLQQDVLNRSRTDRKPGL